MFKKNSANEKVLRAITIGLSTMMAVTSVPMTVLAEEDGIPSEPSETKPEIVNIENSSTEVA